MIILKNKNIYQCEFCKKKFLSRNGAKIHEEQYCKDDYSPHQKGIIEHQKTCPHTDIGTKYSYIAGESVQQPDYDYCRDCGKKLTYNWRNL